MGKPVQSDEQDGQLLFTAATTLGRAELFLAVTGGRVTQTGPEVRNLKFGSIVEQGLPFCGGSLTYHCAWQSSETAETSPITLRTHDCAGSSRDSPHSSDPVVFPPYELQIQLPSGEHCLIDIVLYGDRYNTFGALHCKQENVGAPWNYRPADKHFTPDYLLKETGLTRPFISE